MHQARNARGKTLDSAMETRRNAGIFVMASAARVMPHSRNASS
jgi:hypothetical protein